MLGHLARWSWLAFTCLPLSACIRKQPAADSSPEAVSPAQAAAPAQGSARDHTAALALPSLAQTLSPYFSVGAAVEPVQVTEVGDILAHHFSRLTAENQMKLGTICPTPQCNFAKADQLADFARQRGAKMTGHAFVWHQMTPGWFFKDGNNRASRALVAERLRAHVLTMTKRYADVVDNWDVVNEAISDSPGKTYRDASEGSPWFETFGSQEYVKLAFEFAAQAAAAHDPDVKLYYNDYNVFVPDKRRKIIDMVRWLRQEGVRVDGVGLQGHWNLESPTPAEIRAALDELAEEGLELKLSELDVSLYTQDDHSTKTWQPQLSMSPELEAKFTARYREIFEVLRDNADQVSHVTFWGVTDDRTWLNYWPMRRDNYPLLFDRNHQPKPALTAILEDTRARPAR